MNRVGMSIRTQSPPDFASFREAGIECIELTWQGLDVLSDEVRKQCEDVMASARRHGVEVWSVHIPYGHDWDPSHLDAEKRNETVRKVREVLKLTNEWGVHTAVFHPSYEPVNPEDRKQRLDICRDTLGVLSHDAAKLDVQLSAECLPRTCLGNSVEEIAYLLEGNEDLRVCCDVNHLFKGTPQQFIRQIGSRIRTLHISDNDGLDEKHWMPGDGVLEWNEILDALSAIGYDGPFMYEVREQPASLVMDNYKNLITLMEG